MGNQKKLSNFWGHYHQLSELQQYPELTYREMEAKLRRELQLEMGIRQMEQPTINPELHMPIYYGNLAERILPVVHCNRCLKKLLSCRITFSELIK